MPANEAITVLVSSVIVCVCAWVIFRVIPMIRRNTRKRPAPPVFTPEDWEN